MTFDKPNMGLCLLLLVGLMTPQVASARTAQSASAAQPSQASVAAKSAFGTITAKDADAAHALDAKDIAGAQKLIGKSGAFRGTVAEVYSPRSNGVVLVNFAKNHDDALTAVLMHDDYARFPDMQTLTGKQVLVSGTFTAYKGRPEIILTAPSQVHVVR